MTNTDKLERYIRLVSFGSNEDFFDLDTSLIMDLRDQLEDELKTGELSPDEMGSLVKADELLKSKSTACLQNYRVKINQKTSDSQYLSDILNGLQAFGANEPTTSWWFHVADDRK